MSAANRSNHSHTPIPPYSRTRASLSLTIGEAAVLLSLPVFLLLARYVPFDRLPNTCVFLRVTGYPCPSCGMTRSVMSTVRFNFQRAIEMNPLGIALVLVFGVWWTTRVYEIATGRHTRLSRWASRHVTWLGIAGLSVFLLFGALRIWILSRF